MFKFFTKTVKVTNCENDSNTSKKFTKTFVTNGQTVQVTRNDREPTEEDAKEGLKSFEEGMKTLDKGMETLDKAMKMMDDIFKD